MPDIQEIQYSETRFAPRFPLPNEEIRFHIIEGGRAFAIRDLSITGVSIGLLEHSEMLLFPEESVCQADLKLGDNEAFTVEVEVMRRNAYTVGFRFRNIDQKSLDILEGFISPICIGKSFRKVELSETSKAVAESMSQWFHGSGSTDLYLWQDERGGVNKLLLCLGERFLQWGDELGIVTGRFERTEDDECKFDYDADPDAGIVATARKVLENAEILDYRLVEYLKKQI